MSKVEKTGKLAALIGFSVWDLDAEKEEVGFNC